MHKKVRRLPYRGPEAEYQPSAKNEDESVKEDEHDHTQKFPSQQAPARQRFRQEDGHGSGLQKGGHESSRPNESE